MEIIALPACNDITASNIFWTIFISLLVGLGIDGILAKFRLNARIRSPIALACAATLAVSGFVFLSAREFTSVAIDGNTVKLNYQGKPPVVLAATTITHVDQDTTLQSYRPGRRWKHRLEIVTTAGKTYTSNYVCIDRNKVGPDYQSAIYTRLNDPVEHAEHALRYLAVKSNLASPNAKSIDPQKYAFMFVQLLRDARYRATDKTATEEQQAQGLADLNDLLSLTQKGLGSNHHAASIVYRFIGGAYADRGRLKEAKIYFDRGERIENASRNVAWRRIDDRIYQGGLSMYDYEHPEGPQSPRYVLQW
jgi:hypothetical protein